MAKPSKGSKPVQRATRATPGIRAKPAARTKTAARAKPANTKPAARTKLANTRPAAPTKPPARPKSADTNPATRANAAHTKPRARAKAANTKPPARAKTSSPKPPARAKTSSPKSAARAKSTTRAAELSTPSRRAAKAAERSRQLSLPGLDTHDTSRPALDGRRPDAPAANATGDAPDRAERIATVAADRARTEVDDGAPLLLGSTTVPSGTLAIFDVGLMGYLPRPALDPLLVCVEVPRERALPVIGTRVGAGRFAGCWDHVAIQLGGDDGGPVTGTRKIGEAASDFAQLICIDRAALEHWQHEDSLDQLADFVFSGRDEAALAKTLGARRLGTGDGHGWHDLPLAEAEALADRAAVLKRENKWLITTELRPHSHHFDILAAARASASGSGVLEVGGTRALLFFTTWGEGVFPVYLDVDAEGRPVQLRIQLAPAASTTRMSSPGAVPAREGDSRGGLSSRSV